MPSESASALNSCSRCSCSNGSTFASKSREAFSELTASSGLDFLPGISAGSGLTSSVKKKLNASDEYGGKIVTEIAAYKGFWPADEHHQDFYALNPSYGYCRVVIDPKIHKFEAKFKDRLK